MENKEETALGDGFMYIWVFFQCCCSPELEASVQSRRGNECVPGEKVPKKLFADWCAIPQFEWAWQHPSESLTVRDAVSGLKSLSGVGGKIKLVYTMLTLPAWKSANLTVNFFSTKYTKHAAGCAALPDHMKMQVASMDELPCYAEGIAHNDDGDEDDEIDDIDADGNATYEGDNFGQVVGVANVGNHLDAEVGDHLDAEVGSISINQMSITKFYKSRKSLRRTFSSEKSENSRPEIPSQSVK